MTYVLCRVEYQKQLVYKSKPVYSDGEYIDSIEGWYPEVVCVSPVIITRCESEDVNVIRK